MSWMWLTLILQTTSGAFSLWRPLCQGSYSIAWWPNPPYVYEDNNTISGILPVILKTVVHECCQAQVNLSYSIKLASKVEAVEQVSNGTADFVLPLIVKNGKTKFLSFPLVTIVESPGIAFYSSSPLSSGQALLMIMMKAAPILFLITIMVMIAGTSYWLIERRNETSFIPGVLDGMWWAFVSMTTVGYGDIAPKSTKGRLAAILWILFGLVTCSLFVAIVSSILTMACLSNESSLRDSKIAVLSGSQEHSLAIRKCAKPIPLASVQELANSLERGTSSGALLDSYVAGYYQDLFKKFRLNDLQEDLFNYGVVLMPSVMKYERCFKDFLASRQDYVFSIVSEHMIPLKRTTEQSTAEEMSTKIFHTDAIPIHIAILIMTFSIVAVFGLCFLKDRIKCQQTDCRNIKKVSDKYKMHSKEDALNILQENHKREIVQCLCRMKAEAEMLHEVCNRATIRVENEAKYLLQQNEIFTETCL